MMEPEIADVLAALSSEERRDILRNIYEGEESNVEISPDMDEQRYVAFVHNHIPKLESVGLVTYQEDEGIIHPGPKFGNFERVWETLIEADLV